MANKNYILKDFYPKNRTDVLLLNKFKNKKEAATFMFNKYGEYTYKYYYKNLKDLYYDIKYDIKIWLGVRDFRNDLNDKLYTMSKNVKCIVIEHDSLEKQLVFKYSQLGEMKTRLDLNDLKHNISKHLKLYKREEIQNIHNAIYKLFEEANSKIKKRKETNLKRSDTKYQNDKKIESKYVFFNQCYWSNGGHIPFSNLNKKQKKN